MFLSLIAVLWMSLGSAHADEWLTLTGVGEYSWSTNLQPMDTPRKSRALYLPDAGYIGRNPADKPVDFEVPGPHPLEERRFMRYVNGRLVDAWILRPAPIDATPYEVKGTEEWRGPVLGPTDKAGWKAFGDAVSWRVGTRTVMHWKDRSSATELVASRAAPDGRYAVVRASPLEQGYGGSAKAQITGELKPWFKPVADPVSGCFNNSPKPVEAFIHVEFDRLGRPARIRVESDQISFDVDDCVAGAIARVTAPPDTAGAVRIVRIR